MSSNEEHRQARREFLAGLGAASLAALAAGEPRLRAAEGSANKPKATADSVILLWMAGGMAAPDTLDPKRYEPYAEGLRAEQIISTFPSIPTALDGLRISQGLEETAAVLDRGTLLRSHVQPDLGHILHSRHQYHWHTGYVPPQTVAAPHIGAWMAKVLGPRNEVMPAFINIGQRLEGIGESEEIKAFTTGGFFGSEFSPFNLPYPEKAAEAVKPPEGMGPDRFGRRYRALKQMLEHSPKGEGLSDFHQESMLRSLDAAHRLLGSPKRKAFDLADEDPDSLKEYDTGRFGRGCLLARRLVEEGARFVEVATDSVPVVHWDPDQHGHK